MNKMIVVISDYHNKKNTMESCINFPEATNT